jgi:hypothetical protein
MHARAMKQCLAVAIIGLVSAISPAWARTGPNETGASNSGVVKPPPDEDPGLRKPPPANGSTIKVIPPPGTPGNQPDVVPK